jgi:peroxiredoxin
MEAVTTHPAADPSGYRFEHPRLYPDVLNDMYIPRSDLGPGDKVEAFELLTAAGGRVRSADLAADGAPVLLIFGSQTCPVTESAADGLRELHARFGDRVRFLMVQVREAHPGQTIGQPRTIEQKLRHARDLKDRHDLQFEVVADDIDGTLHRALGSRPNSAYVLNPSGTILFRAQWANETEAIAEALAAIVAGQTPPEPAVTRTFHSMTRTIGHMSAALDAAGKGARLDTWKIAPPLGVMMTLADLFFFLPRSKRGLPAMILTLALAAGVGAAAFYARAGG